MLTRRDLNDSATPNSSAKAHMELLLSTGYFSVPLICVYLCMIFRPGFHRWENDNVIILLNAEPPELVHRHRKSVETLSGYRFVFFKLSPPLVLNVLYGNSNYCSNIPTPRAIHNFEKQMSLLVYAICMAFTKHSPA